MKKTVFRNTIFIFILFFFSSIQTYCQIAGEEIIGLWFNEEKTAKIKVFKEGNKYFGTIIWVKLDPGDSGFDDQNPDPKLQSNPLVGLTILKNFVFDDGEFDDGTIYDPENGKTYNCIMKLENEDKLYVRGYIGFSLFGRTTYWVRIE